MVELLRKGDVVTVWRIDRLGRTTLELIKLMVEFREKGVDLKALLRE
jgi:DNA invertase Pin-like site-specific DNA recombinase